MPGLAFSKFAINLSIASTLALYVYCQYSISTAFATRLLKINIELNIENKNNFNYLQSRSNSGFQRVMNNVFFRSSKLLISVDKLIKFESHLWSYSLNLYTQRLCHRDRQNHEN